jgi:hypothetical protein
MLRLLLGELLSWLQPLLFWLLLLLAELLLLLMELHLLLAWLLLAGSCYSCWRSCYCCSSGSGCSCTYGKSVPLGEDVSWLRKGASFLPPRPPSCAVATLALAWPFLSRECRPRGLVHETSKSSSHPTISKTNLAKVPIATLSWKCDRKRTTARPKAENVTV